MISNGAIVNILSMFEAGTEDRKLVSAYLLDKISNCANIQIIGYKVVSHFPKFKSNGFSLPNYKKIMQRIYLL